jgi:hypothetical protein
LCIRFNGARLPDVQAPKSSTGAKTIQPNLLSQLVRNQTYTNSDHGGRSQADQVLLAAWNNEVSREGFTFGR